MSEADGGYMVCIGHCWSCSAIFAFDPERVPSIRDAEGIRQAICQRCIERANELRRSNGNPLIVPLPGAYPS